MEEEGPANTCRLGGRVSRMLPEIAISPSRLVMTVLSSLLKKD